MKQVNCCRDGLALRHAHGAETLTDRICKQHPDLGAQTRAKAWVRATLHMVENGKLAEARLIFLGEVK